MTHPYPIVEQRSLDPARVKGKWLWRKEFRDHGELPRPNAHHVFVYRVDGEYILDSAQRRLDEEQVVNATHVSLVDLTRDAEVLVELAIPCAEADDFTMRVTFVCTVTNPISVVREGRGDAQTLLRAYLKSHHRIFELGLEYRLDQVNEVRRDVNAQVKAFTTLKPPVISGIAVELRSVEVLTPVEYQKLMGNRRSIEYQYELDTTQQRLDHTLTTARQHNDHHLERDQTGHDHLLGSERLVHEQQLERARVHHEGSVGAQRQGYELDRLADRKAFDREQRGHDREEITALAEVIRNNPDSALANAYVAGSLDATDMAERLLTENRYRAETERTDRQAEFDRKHEERLYEIEQRNEQRRWERDQTREDRKWRREDHGLARAETRRKEEITLEVIRELGKHGYLDMTNLDPNLLISKLTGAKPPERLDRGRKPEELATGERAEAAPAAEDGDEDDDTGVREEDVS
ncbi:hypothetical protein ACGFMK_04880 [Amycolatopsis sp. NPDC049252]|uniref:hypothetical protein n=1 Tax=Amycolatopsis sp. NPDC049252 TaxID=3363933 RepID=UPI0037136066